MKDRIGQDIRVGDTVLTSTMGRGFQENVVVRIVRDEIAQCRFMSSGGADPVRGGDFDAGFRSRDVIVDTTARRPSGQSDQ